MSKLSVGVGLLLIATAGASLYLQQRANNALRREVAGLRDDVRSAMGASREKTMAMNSPSGTAAATANGERRSSEDLVRLREEMATLRKSMQELTQLAQAAQAA